MSSCSCDNCTVCEPPPADPYLACTDCGGPMEWGTADHAFVQDGKVLLIRHIPAYICHQCNNAYYEEAPTQAVMRQFEQFLTTDARCGVEEYQERD